MTRRPLRAATAASLLLACALAAQPSFAQSDADRAAARSLAEEGIRLQGAGRHAEALERLRRAQALFDAPTHLLLIAEEQAALGQLVEAAETYRALARRPASDQAAFRRAQEKGATALAALEPRVPGLVVEVTPASVRDLRVTLDGVALPLALIGVERPTNPGEHSLEASAPGYTSATARVKLEPSAHRTARLTLQPVAAVAIAPAPTAAPAASTAAPAPAQPPPPAEAAAEPTPPPAAVGPARYGFFAGLRLGAAVPAGKTGSFEGSPSDDLTTIVKSGGGGEIDLGLRAFEHFALFGFFEHDVLGKGSSFVETPGVTDDFTATRDAFGAGAQLATWQGPGRIGFFGEAALFGEQIKLTETASAPGVGSCTQTITGKSNAGVRVGGGVHIPVGESFLISPFASVAMASLRHIDRSQSGTVTGCTTESAAYDATSTEPHQVWFVGVGGAYYRDSH